MSAASLARAKKFHSKQRLQIGTFPAAFSQTKMKFAIFQQNFQQKFLQKLGTFVGQSLSRNKDLNEDRVLLGDMYVYTYRIIRTIPSFSSFIGDGKMRGMSREIEKKIAKSQQVSGESTDR